MKSAYVLIVVLCGAAIGMADDWPQWRGPQGLGVSGDTPIPETWSPGSENIRWRAPIPGHGLSSPIVTNGRVFLTTAQEGTQAVWAGRSAVVVGFSISFVCVLGSAVSFRRRSTKRRKHVESHTIGPGIVLDWTIATTTSLMFVAAALVTICERAPVFLKHVPRILNRVGLPYATYLFNIQLGQPAAVWLCTGAISLMGCAAAIGWFRPKSILRPIVVAFVTIAAVFLLKASPSDQWNQVIELWKRGLFVVPALVVAGWHLMSYVGALLRDTPEARYASTASWWLAGLCLGLAGIVFVPPNALRPKLGLQRIVLALDLSTGEIVWQTPVFIGAAGRTHDSNSYATPTPVTDGKIVIAKFGPVIAGLSVDGDLLWRKVDETYEERSLYGAVASPVIMDETVYVVDERERDSDGLTSITALDVATGAQRWKITRSDVHESYTTPMLIRSEYGVELVHTTWNQVISFAAGTGEALWSLDIPTEQIVASMAREKDLLVVGGGTSGPNANVVMRLADAAGSAPETLWTSTKGTPEDASPVLYDGRLFTVTDAGILSCFDVLSGKMLWRRRLQAGTYYSSLLVANGKLFASNRAGETTVLTADEEGRVLSVNKLEDGLSASPAVAGNCLLLRTREYLYCIEASGND